MQRHSLLFDEFFCFRRNKLFLFLKGCANFLGQLCGGFRKLLLINPDIWSFFESGFYFKSNDYFEKNIFYFYAPVRALISFSTWHKESPLQMGACMHTSSCKLGCKKRDDWFFFVFETFLVILTVMPNFSRVRCLIKGVIGKKKLPKQYNKGLSPRDFAIFHDNTQGQQNPSMTEKFPILISHT